ncbi:MAG: putative toxin-antitoxin system toxin component, PIN family [bacterium]|nr:putative toxin-antitoxin system toxin component, PIN family [bacterium]
MFQPPAVVIDTSVLVAALFSAGAKRIVEAWRARSLRLACSPAIMREYRGVLEKIPPIRDRAKTLLDEIENDAATLWIKKPPRLATPIDDPADLKFLECAAAADVDGLISLDAHLLSLKDRQPVPIYRPGEYIDRMHSLGFAPSPGDPDDDHP